MRFRRRAIAAATICVLGLVTACSDSPPPPSQATCPRPEGIVSVGERFPAECSLELMDGSGTVRLGDLAGKPLVINFWASWCGPCVEEMPEFQKVFASLKGRVAFLGVNELGIQGETRGAAQSFARSTGVRYTLAYDNRGVLYAHFSARLVMPVTIFVRTTGLVAHRRFGPISTSDLRANLRTYFGVR